MSETWTLASMNVNGLRSAVRKGFLPWRARSGIDVLCLQELRMQADQMDEDHRAPRGWKSVQMDAEKKGYSGVSIWSRLPVVESSAGCGRPEFDREGRIVRMVTDQATIYSIYFPSGSSGSVRQAYKDTFNEFVLEWLQPELESGRPVAVCGDINVAHTTSDIWNPTGNKKNSGFLPHEREWMDRLLGRGWVDLWRSVNGDTKAYSWWSNRGQARDKDRGWRIDYLLASPTLAERLVSADITGTSPKLSDHCAINATFRRA